MSERVTSPILNAETVVKTIVKEGNSTEYKLWERYIDKVREDGKSQKWR